MIVQVPPFRISTVPVVEAPIPDPQTITFNALSNKSATDANEVAPEVPPD